MRPAAVARALIAGLVLACAPWAASHAASTRFCDQPAALSAAQQDRLFRFAAVIKAALEQSGQSLAIVSRSGLDLSRFGVRYSHAGVSLKAGASTPWSVRQLYFACDEQRPRIYDQGLLGFLLGLDDPAAGYVSIVLLPVPEAAALEQAVLDNHLALQLLGPAYSANAYAYGLRYQNCNQWLVEMLATAWGGSPDGDAPRAQAQQWLRSNGYAPTVFEVGFPPLMWLTAVIPWLHNIDHPADDLAQAHYRVSMPASMEAFVQATVPGATRLEFCHADGRVVLRRGWAPIAEGCLPVETDTVMRLD
jgi:hypothetical protein